MVRVRWVVPVILFSLAMPMGAQSKQSKNTRPPKNLHMVGDHWTPYNPPDPASFPAGSNVHIIVRGDTLWDLANKYYGNPYLWPQLWETNTYITDAHWIYPGDPLLIQGEISTGNVPVVTDVGTAGTQGMETTANLTPVGPPIALGTEADIYCWGYLGDEDEPLPNRVYSFEDVELKYVRRARTQITGVAEGDVIFVEGGTSTGLIAGDTYIVVKPAELVDHPESGDVIGRHYDYRGQVRILCATDNQATAIVTQSCKDIQIGDRLKPMPVVPIPLARQTEMANVCTPESGKTNGYIVNAQDYRHALGEGNVVEINLGRDDFVEPGDFLTVYRYNSGTNTPRQILGEVGVLTAEGKTATGKITRMRYSMRVGDRVELK